MLEHECFCDDEVQHVTKDGQEQKREQISGDMKELLSESVSCLKTCFIALYSHAAIQSLSIPSGSLSPVRL